MSDRTDRVRLELDRIGKEVPKSALYWVCEMVREMDDPQIGIHWHRAVGDDNILLITLEAKDKKNE